MHLGQQPLEQMPSAISGERPETEQLRARFLCPVPQRYVGLCLNRSYTPQAFWTDVIGQVRQDQATQDCSVLVNWARVASTYGPTMPRVIPPSHWLSLAVYVFLWLMSNWRHVGGPGCWRTSLPWAGRAHTGTAFLATERRSRQSAATAGGRCAAARQADRAPKDFSVCTPKRPSRSRCSVRPRPRQPCRPSGRFLPTSRRRRRLSRFTIA